MVVDDDGNLPDEGPTITGVGDDGDDGEESPAATPQPPSIPDQSQQFYPPFSGGVRQRGLNLAVNSLPPTFAMRAFLLTYPQMAESVGKMWDGLADGLPLPNNLFASDAVPQRPLEPGDRVTSSERDLPGTQKFGGYVLIRDGDWAFVLWDSPPPGAITYDPVAWLEPTEAP